jgi:membrane protein implicated in regulation of membrane protease activity
LGYYRSCGLNLRAPLSRVLFDLDSLCRSDNIHSNIHLDLSINAQLVTFILAAAGACFAGHFIYPRLLDASGQTPLLNQRDVELIGKTGVASEDFHFGQGKVRLGDTVWLAEGPSLRQGAGIVVKAVRGTVVIVDVLGSVARDDGPLSK